MSAAKTARAGTARPAVRHLEIDAAHAGQRLDNFLIRELKGVPKTHIYRLVRKGEVRINKGRCRPDTRLAAGDVVRIPPVRGRDAQARHLPAAVAPGDLEWLEGRVLYEDEALLAIDKPSGLAVHGGSGVSLGLIESLRRLRPHAPMLELVHRLDRDTSGCLLVAKKRAALTGLHAQLREGGVDKRYLALVAGGWSGKARRVDAPLAKYHLDSGERRVSVEDAGKESASRFTPQRVYRHGALAATLVEVKLLTGRTHQARVHAAHIGHPIAGDDKYGDPAFNRATRALGLTRLFLHASALRFRHPVSGAALALAAPLPAELAALLDRLAQPEDAA
jgi:23S rRNA pseudouridine955/2504/2580 synthase